MDNKIFDYLESVHGITPPRAYYARIAEWNAWRRGFYKPFHEFSESSVGGVPMKRELYRLNMAQKICEDWASLLLSERTYVYSADSATSEWIGGRDGLHGFIGESGLIRRGTRLVEKAFALGTGAAILRLDRVNYADGRLIRSPGARIRVDFVDAEHIVPISTDAHGITEAAFVSEVNERGREIVYVELHRLGDDGYVITNEWLEMCDGELVPCEHSRRVPREIHTGSRVPLFAILTPNVTNYIDEVHGMGVSVYAQAIDCLKGVDLAFNNFCRD